MSYTDELKSALTSRTNGIYLISWEEDRVEKTLRTLFTSLFPEGKVYAWESLRGIVDEKDQVVSPVKDPREALLFFDGAEEKSLLIFKDFHLFLQNDPRLVRSVRELLFRLRRSLKYLVFTSPFLQIPQEWKKEVEVIEALLPPREELQGLLQQMVSLYSKKGVKFSLTDEEMEETVRALQGMTFEEAKRLLSRLFHGVKEVDSSLVVQVQGQKKQVIIKESVLEYFPDRIPLSEVGGLGNLKDWLTKRKGAFAPEARRFGLDKPRGILVMGISGCGKSLSVKAVSALWNLPLFRLDMNLVYSGIGGAPEEAFSRALKLVESLAPAVLWLDEIESGITDKQAEGPNSRILGYFLTWMQEHKSDIFIGATANRIDNLPAEVLRRGRFDQIFFVDLPTNREREEIFRVHLKKRGNDLSRFNVSQLAQITSGWSGAEIEQVIVSAMYEAYAKKRPLQEDDLFAIFGSSYPLSTTMAEQIKKIRSWAHDRAYRASGEIPEV